MRRRKIGGTSIRRHVRCRKMTTATLIKTSKHLRAYRWRMIPDGRGSLRVTRAADGQLWYSVATTGVYCRPSCPSRIANPENVQLHDSLESARATGLPALQALQPGRAIGRSRERGPGREGVPDHRGERRRAFPRGTGRAVGRSPSYFHRVFKATTGLTPKDYAAAAPRQEGPPGTGLRQHRHRGDLRRRLQFQRSLL